MEPAKKRVVFLILGALSLYLVSTGVSFFAFSKLGLSQGGRAMAPVEVEEGRAQIDLDAPKTETCPLNARLFTKAERQIWEARRPLSVMVENHLDSRPQSGLSNADVVYEAIAEGGITRFMAVFYCGASAENLIVGPVRSARIYYLDFASEYGDWPLYVHIGGANNANDQGNTHHKVQAVEEISALGWTLYNDVDGMSVSYPTIYRDTDRLEGVLWEHTAYAKTDELWKVAAKRGLNAVNDEGDKWDEDFVSWQFKEEAETEERGSVGPIKFSFWDNQPDYQVSWQYNAQNNSYLRSTGNQPHKDLNNDQQLEAKNVVIQFAKEEGPLDPKKHLFYQTQGTGQALVFLDGEVIKATWKKKERESRTIFFDLKGNEIEFNPGQIWIEIVPKGNEIDY